MNKIILAFEKGKVVKWNSNEPRFYKLKGETVLYSDNLKNWKESDYSKEETFKVMLTFVGGYSIEDWRGNFPVIFLEKKLQKKLTKYKDVW